MFTKFLSVVEQIVRYFSHQCQDIQKKQTYPLWLKALNFGFGQRSPV